MGYPTSPKFIAVDRSNFGITIISICRPQVRNCVDGPTAKELAEAFRAFDADDTARVAILTGEGGYFCAGADLKAMLEPGQSRQNSLSTNMEHDGPMGVSRMRCSKPIIAAISGPCVAGGLELAAWADIRVCDETATFGVLCRLRGVPLIDGGTIRLPRLIGYSRAMDLILTGRLIDHKEAFDIGLVNYRVAGKHQTALGRAIELAKTISAHPQVCLRNDRDNVLLPLQEERSLLAREFELGLKTLQSPEFLQSVAKFVNRPRL